MPRIHVVFFQEHLGAVPVLDWLDTLPAKAQDKCFVPAGAIEEAIRMKQQFAQNPKAHTYQEG